MASLSASEIILKYVCPTLGGITGNIMFAAPLRDVYRAAGFGSLGNLNPTPWAFMLGNCYGWVVYGILLRNFFVFFANAPGLLFAVWLNLKAVELLSGQATLLRKTLVEAISSQKQEHQLEDGLEVKALKKNSEERAAQDTASDPDDAADETNSLEHLIAQVQTKHASSRRSVPHEVLVMGMIIAWFGLTSLLVFGRALEQSTKELIVGGTVNLNLVFFYAAPLSTIWTVCRCRSSDSIHVPTMLTNTANGTFWCAYGFAVQDYFIYVPNGLGVLLGAVQILLCIIFPKEKQRNDEDVNSTAAAEKVDVTASMKSSHRSHSASPCSLEMEEGCYRNGRPRQNGNEDPTSTSE